MATIDEQYTCWNCELRYGPEDAPVGPSRLCPTCKEAGVQ